MAILLRIQTYFFKHNLQKLTEDENSFISPNFIKDISSVILKFHIKNGGIKTDFPPTFKKKIAQSYTNSSRQTNKEGIVSNLLYNVITSMPNPDKNIINKENYRSSLFSM